jgi:hypothetical protein
MSESLDPILNDPNTCGCDAEQTGDDHAAALLKIYNPPRLPAIAYRIGDQARFKHALMDTLAHTPSNSACYRLITRSDEDFSIALLDAWSCVADVLTFYQERIANENYLGTATERRSLVYLARLINYQPRPGVAAGSALAYTLEKNSGPLIIPAGSRVQSIPNPGEMPQVYETIQDITAHSRWNEMRPRRAYPQEILADTPTLFLKGGGTGLHVGDNVLLQQANGKPELRKVLDVAPIEPGITRVEMEPLPGGVLPSLPVENYDSSNSQQYLNAVLSLPENKLTDQFVKQWITGKGIWDSSDLASLVSNLNWSMEDLITAVNAQLVNFSVGDAYVFRVHAGLFGCNAPSFSNLRNSSGNPTNIFPGDWDATPMKLSDIMEKLSAALGKQSIEQANLAKTGICLDGIYPAISVNSWVCLMDGDNHSIKTVSKVDETSVAAFTLSARTTRLFLSPNEENTNNLTIRGTTVLAQSEPLVLAEMIDIRPVEGSMITLDCFYGDLHAGQSVFVSGERADTLGVQASEVALLNKVLVVDGYSVLQFASKLQFQYRRDTVKINANIAPATHGETVTETLLSGDSSQAFQSSTLKRAPLTYVRAPVTGGAVTTLEVSVNDVVWKEVPSLFNAGPNDQVYLVRQDEDGKTRVTFGDGIQGARLPTGLENVTARYRAGIGLAGNQAAGKISLLATRPVGVKEVTNPVPASQGDDPESVSQLRRNAPSQVLALDRIVSLQDYEDFAASFAGVSKSLASWTWSGEVRGVFLTLAGPGGAELSENSQAVKNLLTAIRAAGNPNIPVSVASYKQKQGFFQVSGWVEVAHSYLHDQVLSAIIQSLRAAFSFEMRSFGQDVYASEVIAIIQSVPGVDSVDLNALFRSDDGIRQQVLRANTPMAGDRRPVPGELLVLDPRPIDIKERI